VYRLGLERLNSLPSGRRRISSHSREALALDNKNTTFQVTSVDRCKNYFLQSYVNLPSKFSVYFKSTTQHPLPLIPLTPPGAI
jgi:hypothetical protein